MLVDVAGISARYEKAGSGPPVVVLHGWGASLETVGPVIQCLAQSRTVFAVDLPGFGGTSQPAVAWGVSDYVAWVVSFLNTVGCSRVDVLGHSFGGSIAIALAAQYPQRVERLILVNSAGIRAKKSRAYGLRVRLFKALRGALQMVPVLSWRQKATEWLYGIFGSRDYQTAGAMRATLVRVVNEDLSGLLPNIQAPTLVIWGENDRDVPASHGQFIAQTIPNAQLHVLPGAGHYSYLDRLPQFCRLVRDFLSQDGSCRTRSANSEGESDLVDVGQTEKTR